MTAHDDDERHEGGCVGCQIIALKARVAELEAIQTGVQALIDEAYAKNYAGVSGWDLSRVLRGWEPAR